MQWVTWYEEGELSPRERLAAAVAFKIGTNLSLTQAESVAQLDELPDEDILTVLKMVALFQYWQQLFGEFDGKSAEASKPLPCQPPFDPSPYFHEGNPPATSKGTRNNKQ